MCAECLTSSWRLTEMLHTLQCQFTAQCCPTHITLCYVNGTTTHLTCWPFLWPTCDWMLQTLQYRFAAQHSHDYITFFTPTTKHVSLAEFPRLCCNASCSSGFLIFRVSMFSAIFLFSFCCFWSFHLKSDIHFMCPIYFSLFITAKFSGEWVSSIWLIIHLFLLRLNTLDIDVGAFVKANFVKNQKNRK